VKILPGHILSRVILLEVCFFINWSVLQSLVFFETTEAGLVSCIAQRISVDFCVRFFVDIVAK